jgi:hypothetical protein
MPCFQRLLRVVPPVFARFAALPALKGVAANRKGGFAVVLQQNSPNPRENHAVAFAVAIHVPVAEMIETAVAPEIGAIFDFDAPH